MGCHLVRRSIHRTGMTVPTAAPQPVSYVPSTEPAAGHGSQTVQPDLGQRHQVHPDAMGILVFDRHPGLGEPQDFGMGQAVAYPGQWLLGRWMMHSGTKKSACRRTG